MSTAQPDGERTDGGGTAAELIVYTRPGCPFCTSLRAGLRRQELEFREIDIWQEQGAAAAVRALADGNETVPTVVLGDWSAVNPSASQVLDAVREHAPELLPETKPGIVSGTLNALGLRRTDH
ncbi:glutaredoxin domain-containing protein [Saccharopolyspora gloriosae]|uniref:glutaredoxin domain-containing protein n=1 Tax=Saccharopolyspora gloriosae TaxID=455344 RepID=UPI001FB6CF4D|nr:glutaredoxin domain-containing protein [Saccharopolyspora gloriosae]